MAARINRELESLWGRVLKGLYFPNGVFNSANKVARTSWGWASLLQGQDILIQEGLWMIGDGRSIDVSTDPWIYTKRGWRMDDTREEDQPRPMKVAELINPDGTWNEQKVRLTANHTDAACILQIPIPTEDKPDVMIWPFTVNGEATARSV